MVVAVDPGRDKCGVAIVTTSGQALHKAVVPTSDVSAHVLRHTEQVNVIAYALGDGTADDTVRQQLQRAGADVDRIVAVDEYKSSEVGRRAYWDEHPPRGWRRLLPVGLQVPPEPYDDHVAVELARRYLRSIQPT